MIKDGKLCGIENIFFKEDIVLEALIKYDDVKMETTTVDVPVVAGEAIKVLIMDDREHSVDFWIVGREALGHCLEIFCVPREIFELVNDRHNDCPFQGKFARN